MLATLLRPDAGSARIFGHDVQRESQVVRQLIGVTGQYASVDETLSATENLVLFSRLLGHSRRDAKLQGRRAARGVRADRCRQAPAQELLRRHAPPPRPRGQPHRAAAAHLPRRAHHGPRPAHPRADVGHDPPARRHRARPCCSPPSTSTRPTSSPTASRSSTAAASSPRAPPTSSRPPSASRASQLRLADARRPRRRARRHRARARRHADVSPEAGRITAPMNDPDRVTELLVDAPRRGHPPRRAERAEADARRGLPHPHRPRRRGRAPTHPSIEAELEGSRA